MHPMMLQGLEDLLTGIIIPIILSTASTAVYLVIHGWKSIRHGLSAWCLGCFAGVLTHWGCQHYNVSGTFSALLISMAALLSHSFADIIFHPQLKNALLQRLTQEINTRGNAKKRED